MKSDFHQLSRRLHRQGFSLIELLVVMGVIAMLLGLAGGLTGGVNEATRISTAAANVHGVISAARQMAVATNTRVRFFVVTDNGSNPDDWRQRAYGVVAERFDDEAGDFAFESAGKLHYLPAGVFFDEALLATGTHEVRGGNHEVAFIEFLPTGGTSGSTGANRLQVEARPGREQAPKPNLLAEIGVAGLTGRVRMERP